MLKKNNELRVLSPQNPDAATDAEKHQQDKLGQPDTAHFAILYCFLLKVGLDRPDRVEEGQTR